MIMFARVLTRSRAIARLKRKGLNLSSSAALNWVKFDALKYLLFGVCLDSTNGEEKVDVIFFSPFFRTVVRLFSLSGFSASDAATCSDVCIRLEIPES